MWWKWLNINSRICVPCCQRCERMFQCIQIEIICIFRWFITRFSIFLPSETSPSCTKRLNVRYAFCVICLGGSFGCILGILYTDRINAYINYMEFGLKYWDPLEFLGTSYYVFLPMPMNINRGENGIKLLFEKLKSAAINWVTQSLTIFDPPLQQFCCSLGISNSNMETPKPVRRACGFKTVAGNCFSSPTCRSRFGRASCYQMFGMKRIDSRIIYHFNSIWTKNILLFC